MILFVLGIVLGAAAAAALTHVYAQNELKSYVHDLALLQARLRTLVRLTEAGFIRPDTVEAANVLNEVHDLVVEARALGPDQPNEQLDGDGEIAPVRRSR